MVDGGADLALPADMATPFADFGTMDLAVPLTDGSSGDAMLSDSALEDTGVDAGPTTYRAYGFIAGKLVWIDTTRAGLNEVGPSAIPDIRLGWDATANVMRFIANPLTAPRIGVIDLCTAETVGGSGITYLGAMLKTATAIAQNTTTGVFYVAFNPTPASPSQRANNLGTLNTTTGAVTLVGPLDSLQMDVDALTYGDTGLYAFDNSGTDAAIYTVDTASAGLTQLTHASFDLQRIVWGPSQHAMFSWNVTTRQTVRVNLSTGAQTNLGEVAPSSIYGSSAFTTFAFAPPPVCP